MQAHYPLGGKRVAIGSGDPTVANPTAAVQLLDTGQFPFVLPDGSLQLGAGDVLQVAVQATVTAAKAVSIVAQYGDY